MEDRFKTLIKNYLKWKKDFETIDIREKINYIDFKDYVEFQIKQEEKLNEDFDDYDDNDFSAAEIFRILKDIWYSLPTWEDIEHWIEDFFGYDRELKGLKKGNNIVKIILKIFVLFASISLFLCMLTIQLCTYKLFEGELIATNGNNEIFTVFKLFVYWLVFSQKDLS